jgi:hypothetical protein
VFHFADNVQNVIRKMDAISMDHNNKNDNNVEGAATSDADFQKKFNLPDSEHILTCKYQPSLLAGVMC